MSTLSPTKALAERSPNTSSPSRQQEGKIELSKPTVATFELAEPKNKHLSHSAEPAPTYHSPSDNILSPTSKKLSEIKGKRFASAKPQSLFAKTVRKEGLKSQEKLESSGTR